MKSNLLFCLLMTVLLITGSAHAQQPKKIPRIGLLLAPTRSFYSARVEAFRQGMRELGYVEGKNLVIEYRYAEGKIDRLPDLAAELVHLKVDLILTASNDGVLAAKKATSTIPIVFGTAADPVGSGLVASLAQPGGNITGLSNIAQDVYGKRLELLKESFPKATRVAFLCRSSGPRKNLPFTEMEAVAKALGVTLQPHDVRGVEDFDSAFEAAKREGAQAVITCQDPIINAQQARILHFAPSSRLPAIYAGRDR